MCDIFYKKVYRTLASAEMRSESEVYEVNPGVGDIYMFKLKRDNGGFVYFTEEFDKEDFEYFASKIFSKEEVFEVDTSNNYQTALSAARPEAADSQAPIFGFGGDSKFRQQAKKVQAFILQQLSIKEKWSPLPIL